jgi:osmoprotectant transport system substrate-binding protein
VIRFLTRRLPRAVAALTALTALTALAACGSTADEESAGSQPQGAALRITLGTQEFPEARILGELWRQALAVNGYTVDLRKGVGPAEDLDELLRAGEIDGYVAYTGTVLSIVAGEDVTGLDPDQTYAQAKAFYAGRDMAMSAMTPFENKDAIATTTQFAQANRLQSIGDLGELPSFRLGARPEFEDLYLGLEGLVDLYGLTNAEFDPVTLGQQYEALDQGKVDAVNAFTTDPQLRSGSYQVLDDPQLLFGSQNVVMVVGEDELERVGQETFLRVVDAVNGLLTQDVMVDLNAAVTEGQDEAAVAERFLGENGLTEPIGGDS